jgi:type I restriction enzyme M protein
VNALKPNVGLLNPPFSKKAKGKSELAFVKRSLDLLQPNGTAFSLVPVSALIEDSAEMVQARKDILSQHTLRAVMSMPPQLFPGIGTVAAIAVLQAHVPHHRTVKNAEGVETIVPRTETWFGYWRDDGFTLRKGKRVERKPGTWKEIKTTWLDAYFNQRVAAGRSCKVAVTSTDEWIAEAYLDTDYSVLTKEDYERDVKRYMLFNVMLETNLGLDDGSDET